LLKSRSFLGWRRVGTLAFWYKASCLSLLSNAVLTWNTVHIVEQMTEYVRGAGGDDLVRSLTRHGYNVKSLAWLRSSTPSQPRSGSSCAVRSTNSAPTNSPNRSVPHACRYDRAWDHRLRADALDVEHRSLNLGMVSLNLKTQAALQSFNSSKIWR
jgi:hypothetical protein